MVFDEKKRDIDMKTLKLVTVLVAALMAPVSPSFAQPASSAQPQVLQDGEGAKVMRFENMYKTRFVEIFLAGRDAKTGKTVAACYNSMYTPKGSPTSRDTAPQAWAEGLDMDKLKKEFGVAGASLNGPKIWMPDWVELKVGKAREFNGRQFNWVAQLEIGEKGGIADSGGELHDAGRVLQRLRQDRRA